MTDPIAPTTTMTTTGRPPGTVQAAFWLYLIAPAVGILTAILALVALGSAAAVKAGVSTASTTGAIATGIVVDVVLLVVVIVVDVFFRRGANWARIVLTVLGVLSLFAGGLFTFIIAVVAIILSWLPASNAWFRSLKGSAAPRTA